ncbi:MAG: hypothetical protein ACOC1U_08385 [Spirochaetota bacterium]
MDDSFWGELERPDMGETSWQIGRCRIWARSAEDEWEIASRHVRTDEAISDVPVDELDWTRFVTVANDQVHVTPALPDRPVIVRPRSPIVILPGRWGRFFFRVPLWVRFVSQPGERQSTMAEIPTRQLASTWFGDLATGELCYAIEAPLQRRLEALELTQAFAACEVSVRNQSRERLRFERICVHVEHMRLFEADGSLWTNEVRVAFRGADQISQLTFLPRPPDRIGTVIRVCDPRIPPEANIIKRSFALIREIAGFSG